MSRESASGTWRSARPVVGGGTGSLRRNQYASRWLNLLWWDSIVESHPPGDLPTLHHFADMGIVSARSAWKGDESLVVFKCGPPIGYAY